MERLIHLDHKKIDISGPKGNAFVILGTVQALMKQCRVPQEDIDRFMWEAQSDDYDNLCAVVTEATGIQLVDGRPDQNEWL